MLVNLKKTIEEKKEDAEVSILDRADYPYGLRLHLETDVVKKLEMSKPSLGDMIPIIASAEVVSINKEDNGEGFSIALQITDMDIKKVKEEKERSAEDILFGGD